MWLHKTFHQRRVTTPRAQYCTESHYFLLLCLMSWWFTSIQHICTFTHACTTHKCTRIWKWAEYQIFCITLACFCFERNWLLVSNAFFLCCTDLTSFCVAGLVALMWFCFEWPGICLYHTNKYQINSALKYHSHGPTVGKKWRFRTFCHQCIRSL